ncbi:MAG: helix-turn-helix domain-containing protein [Clostridiales bacterium]|nr:helix-turn-helix domain-containing protein [Clostridiales bacterium]
MEYLQDIYFANFNVVYNSGRLFSISQGKDWSCGKCKFEQCKFYLILNGECKIVIEGKEYLGKQGDWFFIPANTEHSYANVKSKKFQKYWLHFDIYPNAEIFDALNLPYCVKVQKGSKAEKLFKSVLKSANSEKVTDKLAVKSATINLLSEYIKCANSDGVGVSSRTNERIDSLLRFINENLKQPLTNNLLAEKYYAHPNHFIRAFKDKTGVTPAKYIKTKRLAAAKVLLESTDLTISEIAEKVGIIDDSHFSRDFKKYYNMSPAKYRQYFDSKK